MEFTLSFVADAQSNILYVVRRRKMKKPYNFGESKNIKSYFQISYNHNIIRRENR